MVISEAAAKKQKEARRKRSRDYQAETQECVIRPLSNADRRRRLELEKDPEAWIWEMCGPGSGIDRPLTRPFTSQDSDMIGSFFETVEFGGSQFTLACRGGGKTSRLRECILLGLLSGKIRFEIYFASNAEKAGDSQEYVEHVLAESEDIARYYPEVSDPVRALGYSPSRARGMTATGCQVFDRRKKFNRHPIRFQWSKDGLWFPRVPGSPSAGARFLAFGLEKPPRGLNKLGARPDHASIDDPDTEDTTNNGSLAERVINFINMDIGGLGGEGRSLGIDILCTLSHKGEGVAYRLSGPDSQFVVRRHVFMLAEPARMDLWMRYVDLRKSGKHEGDKYGRKAHALYAENREQMDAGAMVVNEHRFDASPCPDGSPKQLSALQAYFDDWADRGERFCQCELNNERIDPVDRLLVGVSPSCVLDCVGDLERKAVQSTTRTIVRGVDIRKTEIHWATLAVDQDRPNRIVDYDIRQHGNSETTVQQAEQAILEGLRKVNDEWSGGYCDENGMLHSADLTLIDKGWVGNWTEDGVVKTWVSQPVEVFCMEAGLRRFLPAKGQPNYRSPEPDDKTMKVIVGDNWHINREARSDRRYSEVIWNADHWHLLVEELFMLPVEERDRFELFIPRDGIWTNHKALGEHITAGAEVMKEAMNRGARTKKPRFVRDHWWDAVAMALVAKSIEEWFRSNVDQSRQSNSRRRQGAAERQRAAAGRNYEEVGAR